MGIAFEATPHLPSFPALELLIAEAAARAATDADALRRARLWAADCAARSAPVFTEGRGGTAVSNAVEAARRIARAGETDALRDAAIEQLRRATGVGPDDDASADDRSSESHAIWAAIESLSLRDEDLSDTEGPGRLREHLRLAARAAAMALAGIDARRRDFATHLAVEEVWQYDRLAKRLGAEEPDDWPTTLWPPQFEED